MSNNESQAVASNDQLGPLPAPMQDYPEPGERTYNDSALIAFGRQERAAERERWREVAALSVRLEQTTAKLAAEHERIEKLLRAAEVLFSPLCRDATAMNWCDETRATLAAIEGPNTSYTTPVA